MREDNLLCARPELLQPDLVRDVVELLAADVVELFAARLKLFVELDGRLGHLFVRVLRAADEREIIAFGDALVPVGIQAEAEDPGFAFGFFGIRHVIQPKQAPALFH